ncbi:MAG TPA: serine/threonine-protein kinase [Candidatus Acidoferrales bacterium]|nr:serine/threonine-protein kinase [Candidatus Acidoferrales bacterium]
MALAPGTRLGPYTVTAVLGMGGMGEVYRAHDERLARDVALKVLRTAMCGDAERLRRFEREARAAALLNHPNVVVIHDIGTCGDTTYLAMELLEGKTLRSELASGAMPVRRAIGWGIQIAIGLAAAHEKGIIHRDLKPENVFITRDGRAKILDFGIAKLVERAASADATASAAWVETIPGTMLGTVGYMSPEQVRGEEVDFRTDIFSLGAILYEMLSGVRAFGGNTTVEALNAILKHEPEELTGKNSEISPTLWRVVERTLEKDARERFCSSLDVAFVLKAVTPEAHIGRYTGRSAQSRTEVVVREFALTDRICKQLDRRSLDPRIIGGQMQYADNCLESDVLLCCLHGTGLDASDFTRILEAANCRAVAPTLCGFEAHSSRRIRLRVSDHLAILREWLRHIIDRDDVKAIILVGFSTGADLWLEFACHGSDSALPLAGLVALDANVSYETCWVTRILSNLSPDTPAHVVQDLQTLSAGTRTLNEWFNVHEYLVRVLRKFEGNLEVLTQFATEIVHPFEGTGLDAFTRRFRCATSVIPCVRLVFSGAGASNPEAEAIASVKLTNLDTAFLGAAYSEESIVVDYDADHFELLDLQRLKKLIDPIFKKAARAYNTRRNDLFNSESPLLHGKPPFSGF